MAIGFGVGVQRLGSFGVDTLAALSALPAPATGVRPTGFVYSDPDPTKTAMTPLRVKDAINANEPKIYTSSDQTYALSTNVTVAHGLGAEPDIVIAYLVNVTTQWGWTAGQKAIIGAWGSSISGIGHLGSQLEADATNVIWRPAGTNLQVPDKTTPGSFLAVTPANWRVRFKAIKL